MQMYDTISLPESEKARTPWLQQELNSNCDLMACHSGILKPCLRQTGNIWSQKTVSIHSLSHFSCTFLSPSCYGNSQIRGTSLPGQGRMQWESANHSTSPAAGSRVQTCVALGCSHNILYWRVNKRKKTTEKSTGGYRKTSKWEKSLTKK